MKTEFRQPNLLHIFQGAMAEQFVGQEIIVSQAGRTYVWARQAKSSTAEVDFLALINDTIVPVEVKSGSSGRLKSLHIFLDKYRQCPFGIVFSSRPYAELKEQKIVFMPLYYAFSATGGDALLS